MERRRGVVSVSSHMDPACRNAAAALVLTSVASCSSTAVAAVG